MRIIIGNRMEALDVLRAGSVVQYHAKRSDSDVQLMAMPGDDGASVFYTRTATVSGGWSDWTLADQRLRIIRKDVAFTVVTEPEAPPIEEGDEDETPPLEEERHELPPIATFTGWELIDRLRAGTVFEGGDGLIRLCDPDSLTFEVRRKGDPWMKTSIGISAVFGMTLTPCEYPYSWDEALRLMAEHEGTVMTPECDVDLEVRVSYGYIHFGGPVPIEALRSSWKVA